MKKTVSSCAHAVVRCTIILFMVMPVFSCAKKPSTNRVDMDQINYDDSTNYGEIFKDDMKKQKEKENRYKKDNF